MFRSHRINSAEDIQKRFNVNLWKIYPNDYKKLPKPIYIRTYKRRESKFDDRDLDEQKHITEIANRKLGREEPKEQKIVEVIEITVSASVLQREKERQEADARRKLDELEKARALRAEADRQREAEQQKRQQEQQEKWEQRQIQEREEQRKREQQQKEEREKEFQEAVQKFKDFYLPFLLLGGAIVFAIILGLILSR